MSDIALVWTPSAFQGDLAITANDVALDEGLQSAVVLSLRCDRRAEDSDVLPDGATDRRGWWGDQFGAVPSDRIGSRLWLLNREKQRDVVLRQAEAYARESLQWLIDDHVASAVTVTAEFTRAGMLGLHIVIERPHADVASFTYELVWNGQAAKG